MSSSFSSLPARKPASSLNSICACCSLPCVNSPLRLLAQDRERQHQAAEVISLHFDEHLCVELIQLLLCGDPHLDDKGLEQFEDDCGIAAKPFVGFCAGGEIDHVRRILD